MIVRGGGALVLCLHGLAAHAAVTLEPSHPSPWQVGGIVTWTANASPGSTDAYWYRFRARRAGTPFRVWKDFGPENSFTWTDNERPGAFEIEVVARDRTSGDTSSARAQYILRPNIAGDQPSLIETAHPLVLLYNAPPCDEGSRIKVRFQALDGPSQETPYRPCDPSASLSFLIGGLRQATQYFAYHVVDTGESFDIGPIIGALTPSVDADLPEVNVLTPAPPGARDPVILHENVFASQIATDLSGRVIWYYPGAPLTAMTRPTGEGTFFGIIQDVAGDPWRQTVREFNLIGMPLRETNAGRVNEQLKAMGRRPINAFHHDAMRLPDGNIAVLGGVEQILTGVQSTGATDVLGDAVIVLDPDLNVVWAWDAFDHLDPHRRATLGDQCFPNACPPLQLAGFANDWTHSNSLEYTSDGNLLVSVRNQDWILKINYDTGEGDGVILWRLGLEGDFKLTTADPSGWFSHQHDPRYEPRSPDLLMVLDNGNTRRSTNPQANSRGQVYRLDEQAKTAELVVNADLGTYSLAVGSTEKLRNGNYWFDSGFLPDASGIASEIDAAGKTVFSLRTAAPVYRSYRLADMYSLPGGLR